MDRGLVARRGAFKTNMASSPCSNGRRPSWRLIYRSESGQVPSQSLFRTVLVLVYRLGLHLNVTIPWPMTGRCRSRCVARRWTVLLRLRRLGLLAIGRRGRGQAASLGGFRRAPWASGPGRAWRGLKGARPSRWHWRTWPSLGQRGTRAPLAPGRAAGGKDAHPRLPHQDNLSLI